MADQRSLPRSYTTRSQTRRGNANEPRSSHSSDDVEDIDYRTELTDQEQQGEDVNTRTGQRSADNTNASAPDIASDNNNNNTPDTSADAITNATATTDGSTNPWVKKEGDDQLPTFLPQPLFNQIQQNCTIFNLSMPSCARRSDYSRPGWSFRAKNGHSTPFVIANTDEHLLTASYAFRNYVVIVAQQGRSSAHPLLQHGQPFLIFATPQNRRGNRSRWLVWNPSLTKDQYNEQSNHVEKVGLVSSQTARITPNNPPQKLDKARKRRGSEIDDHDEKAVKDLKTATPPASDPAIGNQFFVFEGTSPHSVAASKITTSAMLFGHAVCVGAADPDSILLGVKVGATDKIMYVLRGEEEYLGRVLARMAEDGGDAVVTRV